MSDLPMPQHELLRERFTMLPDGATSSADAACSNAKLPVIASAVLHKRKLNTTLSAGPIVPPSSLSLRSTCRRTSFAKKSTIHDQVEPHVQKSQIAVPMPNGHIRALDMSSPLSKQVIASVPHRKHSAERPLNIGGYEESISVTHANISHREAMKRRRMLLCDRTTNSADATSLDGHPTLEQDFVLTQANSMHQQLDSHQESSQATTSSSVRNPAVLQHNRHRRNVSPQIWLCCTWKIKFGAEYIKAKIIVSQGG